MHIISVKDYLGSNSTPDWVVLLFHLFDLATFGILAR